MSQRTCARAHIRRAAIVGSAVICLAALGARSDARFDGNGPPASWLMSGLTPVRWTAGLMNLGDPVASLSDSARDTASLLVLGVSLIGGGRIIRRLRQKAAQHPEQAGCSTPSRSPVASTQVGPRRVAR